MVLFVLTGDLPGWSVAGLIAILMAVLCAAEGWADRREDRGAVSRPSTAESLVRSG